MRRVAVVGLGRMGSGLCRRLVQAGFEVTAHDACPDLEGEARRLGAGWSVRAAEAVDGAGWLVTSLPGPAEVAAVGAQVLPFDGVWVEMSTAIPATAQAMGGGAVVDAPVAGGPPEAAEGRLLAFAGGTSASLRRARPLLDALCERVVHAGPPGSGYAIKLLVNALWFTQAVATSEVVALGRRLGLTDAVLREGLETGPSDSRFVREDLPRLLSGDPMPDFPLARCCAELEAVLGLAGGQGLPAEVMAVVADLHREALARFSTLDGELVGARHVLDPPVDGPPA